MNYRINSVSEQEIHNWLLNHEKQYHTCIKGDYDKSVLGWWDLKDYADDITLGKIQTLAEKVRKDCDVFLLCGVGGSNGSARSVIEYFKKEIDVEVRYIGNNLSARYLKNALSNLENKRVYANVIAKDFRTLEPGITFRLLREFFESRGEKPNEKIILTGTIGSRLEQIATKYQYKFLEFPQRIGGRYTAISSVGLFPLAVCGIDIREIVTGATQMRQEILKSNLYECVVAKYVATRQIMIQKGYKIENLCHFEPELYYFSRWWLQLFGESEGKNESALLPYSCNYSEDLHAIGQYIQEGRKDIFETFLNGISDCDFTIEADATMVSPRDDFQYLDGKAFSMLNKAVFEGTKTAHEEGGIPVGVLEFGTITPRAFGELFYYFMFACFFSCLASGVNPFDQPGVESYKKSMYSHLKF